MEKGQPYWVIVKWNQGRAAKIFQAMWDGGQIDQLRQSEGRVCLSKEEAQFRLDKIIK